MITEDYVSFETAKLLKEKGFPQYKKEDGFVGLKYNMDGELTTAPYAEHYRVITQAMAMKWLREEKGIAVIPIISSVLDFEKFLWEIKIVVAKTNDSYSQGWVYEKLENACETAIKYCLENLI